MVDRLDLRRRLQEVAFGQRGYFTAQQAIHIGYSYQAQKYHVDRGNWIRIDRAMFRLAGWPSADDDAYARWSVWSEGKAVVSHHSAAEVHAIGDLDPGSIHLTTSGRLPATDMIVVHTADLATKEVEERPSYRVTTPTRTILDLATTEITQEQLTAALEDALTRKLVRTAALARAMDAFGDRAALRLERALNNIAAEPQ